MIAETKRKYAEQLALEAERNRNDPNWKPPYPKVVAVSISELDKNGEMKLTFNQPLMLPPFVQAIIA
jgi:hypothetical protein